MVKCIYKIFKIRYESKSKRGKTNERIEKS